MKNSLYIIALQIIVVLFCLSGCGRSNDINTFEPEQSIQQQDIEEVKESSPVYEILQDTEQYTQFREPTNDVSALPSDDLEFFFEFLSSPDNLRCLIPGYYQPSQADVDAIFYSGSSNAEATNGSLAALPEAEQEAIEKAFCDMPSMKALKTEQAERFASMSKGDLIKITCAQVDEFLLSKFGLRYDAMDTVFSDFAYSADYKSYYKFVSDTNRFSLALKRGRYEDKETVVLDYLKSYAPDDNGEVWTVTLKKSGDTWLFVSNHPFGLAEARYEDDLYMYYQQPTFEQGIVVENTKVRLLPTEDSNWVFESEGFYVDIIASVTVRGTSETWLLVNYHVWEAFETDIGWVPANSVAPYTEETKEYLLQPLTLTDNAIVYNENTGNVIDASFVSNVFIEKRTPYTEKLPLCDGDYVLIGSEGGWTGVIKKSDLVYPMVVS